MLLTLPLVPLFMWLIGLYTEQRTRERWQELRRLSTHFLDVVRGLPTLRAFNRGRAQTARIAEISERYRRATMATLRVSFLSGSVLELAATLGVALVAVTVGVRLVDGGIGLQAGLTVLVLAPELYLPLRRLGAEFHASADGLAVAARMLDLLDAPPAVGSGGARIAPSPAAAPVRLERVCFSYPARPRPVLDGLDLELAPGETVALVGESGAGKSTVAALLLRLLEPTAGRVSVGGVDLADCRTDAWRRLVAWVPQHPTLLRGSVADNIRLGDAAASDAAGAAGGGAGGRRPLHRGAPARATRRSSATAAGRSPPASAAGSGSRAPSSATRRWSCSTSPRPTSTRPARELVAEAVERACAGRTVLLIAHRPELVRASRSGRPSRAAAGRSPSRPWRPRDGDPAPAARVGGRLAPPGRAQRRARRPDRDLRRRADGDGRLPDRRGRPSSRRSSR